jgi:uncharacterized surface protein with fasciclin (FAS1) repeats
MEEGKMTMVMTKLLTTCALGVAMLGTSGCGESDPIMVMQPDLVTVASEAGQFNTLVAAVQAAGLVEALQGDGPFTVFAPRDAAFEALPAGALDELLANPEALRAVLTYHVLPGRVSAADVVAAGGAMPTTLNGATLDITVSGGTVRVNDATVVTADVQARNGVIHVIDRVLLP